MPGQEIDAQESVEPGFEGFNSGIDPSEVDSGMGDGTPPIEAPPATEEYAVKQPGEFDPDHPNRPPAHGDIDKGVFAGDQSDSGLPQKSMRHAIGHKFTGEPAPKVPPTLREMDERRKAA